MANGISERTPQIIAAEINSIKDQTGRMLLYSSVEIGRRLTEAKSIVNHGEWGKWLENSVSYSQSTANKLMRLFEEYEAKLTAGQDSSNSESIPNLSYTQAIILWGIPEEEQESFMAEHDVASMSTRELKQAVRERDQALNEKAELQNALTANQGAVTEITSERDELRKQASGLQAAIHTKELTIKTLQGKMDSAKEGEASAGKIAALEKDIKAARIKLSAKKVSFLYNNITNEFEELLKELTKLAPADPEAHEKYKSEVSGLIGKIAGRL
ncbi:DUF3102 domain-containing protein [Desulfosporosinus nitroreducens]|uniref:DUF3102 domain-containing protein n=1 Tax=Desulfosporosinus nitroreducens TaxID=2018668 RepID=A0ABT8QLR3_9FIRM|nr:DUF3102 domain-containing protein [Desulfosporosinus nitroreducens]MDO0822282.1 DUF3102 domain-containing protein [Desulfosporosinus nitroreducens]